MDFVELLKVKKLGEFLDKFYDIEFMYRANDEEPIKFIEKLKEECARSMREDRKDISNELILKVIDEAYANLESALDGARLSISECHQYYIKQVVIKNLKQDLNEISKKAKIGIMVPAFLADINNKIIPELQSESFSGELVIDFLKELKEVLFNRTVEVHTHVSDSRLLEIADTLYNTLVKECDQAIFSISSKKEFENTKEEIINPMVEKISSAVERANEELSNVSISAKNVSNGSKIDKNRTSEGAVPSFKDDYVDFTEVPKNSNLFEKIEKKFMETTTKLFNRGDSVQDSESRGDSVVNALINAKNKIGAIISDAGELVTHPVDTVTNIGKSVGGSLKDAKEKIEKIIDDKSKSVDNTMTYTNARNKIGAIISDAGELVTHPVDTVKGIDKSVRGSLKKAKKKIEKIIDDKSKSVDNTMTYTNARNKIGAIISDARELVTHPVDTVKGIDKSVRGSLKKAKKKIEDIIDGKSTSVDHKVTYTKRNVKVQEGVVIELNQKLSEAEGLIKETKESTRDGDTSPKKETTLQVIKGKVEVCVNHINRCIDKLVEKVQGKSGSEVVSSGMSALWDPSPNITSDFNGANRPRPPHIPAPEHWSENNHSSNKGSATGIQSNAQAEPAVEVDRGKGGSS